MTTDDQYIWAWKNAGMPSRRIAAKLNLPIEEVERRYQLISEVTKNQKLLGIDQLVLEFNALCFQYQVLGEKLKNLGANLCDPVTPQEVKDQLHPDAEESVKSLMKSFIILHPWKGIKDPS